MEITSDGHISWYIGADGTYMDRIERRFTYNGTDTWTDEDGVEWNAAAESGQKLELVDAASKKPLTDDVRKLLDMTGCADMENTWGSELPEPVDAIMQVSGLRDFHPWEH